MKPPLVANGPNVTDHEILDILQSNCTSCHNRNHRLDLTTPPSVDASGLETWNRIAEVVASQEMPPSTPGNPFPLDPEMRSSFVEAVRKLLPKQERATAQPMVAYPPDVWLSFARRTARSYLSEAEFVQLVRERRAGLGGRRTIDEDRGLLPPGGGDSFAPLDIVSKRLIAYEICKRIVTKEATSHSPKFFRGVSLNEKKLPESEVSRVALGLRDLIFEGERTDTFESETRASYTVFREATIGAAETVTAMCTSSLSGPETNFLPGYPLEGPARPGAKKEVQP